VERHKRNTGALPDELAVRLRDALIGAAEELGDITHEWKGRHLVRKWTGKGGLAGYFRSIEIICPAEFHDLVRRVFRLVLTSEDTSVIDQIFADVDTRLTLHEFCAMYLKRVTGSHSRAPSRPADAAKRRQLKAFLDDLEPDPRFDLNWLRHRCKSTKPR
jgi:hypothetical protein